MKAKSTFQKALIFAVAMVLTLVMVTAVIPTAFADNAQSTNDFGEVLSASNINISGDITMMFYFKGLDSNGYEADDFIRITVPTQNGGKTTTDIKIADLEKSGDRWVVKVPVAYAQQTDKVTMQWFQDGKGGKIREKSVKDYADKVLALAAEGNATYTPVVAPIVNMLNVGALTQEALGYNTDKLANEGLFTAGNPVDNMLAEHFYDVEAKPEVEDKSEYISFVGGQVFLQSKVNLRLYVECPDSVTTATVSNGTATATVKVKKDELGRKYVGVNNIAATSFNTRFTVTLSYNGVAESYSYSVLDYAHDTLESFVTSDAQKSVAKALYLFYAHTLDYVDTDYVAGPQDCKHERTYQSGENNVCADCGKTVTSTQITVAVVGNPTVYANEETTITLAFALCGDVDLTSIVFTPKCEGATFTLVDFTFNEEKLAVSADKNFLVLNQDVKAALTAGEIATATYKITAPAGAHKISVAVREATNAQGETIENVGTIISGIATVNVANKECAEHTVAYAALDKDNHVAYCSVCAKNLGKAAHEYVETKVQSGSNLIHKSTCACGSTAFYNVIPAGTVENPEVINSIADITTELKAGDADGYYYKWTADKKGIYTFAVPADAAYTVTATASIADSTSTMENGYVSIYAVAGSEIIINVKALPVEDAYPAVTAKLSGAYTYGATGKFLAGGSATSGDVTVYCGELTNSVTADGVTYSYNGISNPSYSISLTRTENERYMAITYKSNGFVDTSKYYCRIYDVAAGTSEYNEGTRFNKAVTFINDNEWHTMIIDTWAFMNGTASNGTTRDTMNGDYRLDSIRLDFRNLTEGASFTVKAIELSDNKTYLNKKYGIPCEHVFEWAPVNGKAYEQQVCSVCGDKGEEREAAFYLSPDNLRVDGTTTKHIVNNSGKNQTTGLGFSTKKSTPLVVNATDIFADGKYVTTTVGLGGWVTINGGAKTYVYRVNGGEWQEATCHVSSLDDSKTAHIKLVEESNLGIKDYYANVLLDSGIFTKDLQADYGGQTVTIEFAAVPNNNPEAQIVFAKFNNIKIFKVNSVELGEFAVNTDGAVYQYTATKTGVYNVECPVIDGVSYNVTITNKSTGETVTKTNAGGAIAGVDVKSGNVVTVLVTSDKTVNGTFNSTCYYGAHGSNVVLSGFGATGSKVVDGYTTAYPGGTVSDAYFKIFSGQSLKVSENRYMAVTYKLTGNVTSINSLFYSGKNAAGDSVSMSGSTQLKCSSYKLINDGQWHTIVLDLYELVSDPEFTISDLRFDTLESVTTDSTFGIMGYEFSNDHVALTTKYNCAVLESAGIAFAPDSTTNLKALDRDAEGNYVYTNSVVTSDKDCSAYIINEKTTPGRYFAITAKAGNADTYVSQIYFKGFAADGVTIVDYKNAGAFYVNKDGLEGEWVTLVVDMYALMGNNFQAHTIRFDACEFLSTAATGNMTIKHWGIYNDLGLALASGNDSTRILIKNIPDVKNVSVSVPEGDSNGFEFETKANIIGLYNVSCPDMGGVKYNVTINNVTKGTTVTSGAIASGNVAIEAAQNDVIRVTVVAEPVDGNYPALNGTFDFSAYYAKYGSSYTLPSAANCEKSRDDDGNYVITKTGSGTPYFEVVYNTGSNTFNGRYLAITYKTVGCTGATGGFTKYYKANGTYVGWTDSTGEVTRYGTHITMKADTEDWQTVIIDTYDLMLYKGKLEEGAKLYALRLDCGAMKVGESITFKGVEFHDDYEYLASKFDNVTYVGVN